MDFALFQKERKKANEAELEKLQGTRFQLEMQVNTLESASFNAETMAAMKTASDALKTIHGKLCVGSSFFSYASFASLLLQCLSLSEASILIPTLHLQQINRQG